MANRNFTEPSLAGPPDGPSNIATLTSELATVAFDDQGTSVPADGDGEVGDYFWDSDDERLWRHNGSVWKQVLPGVGDIITAMLADEAVTPAKLGVPEVVSAYLAGATTIGHGASDNLNDSGNAWTKVLDKGGSFLDWDDTNNRPFAVAGGIFEISWTVNMSIPMRNTVVGQTTLTLRKNAATDLRVYKHYDGGRDEEFAPLTARDIFSGTAIVELATNDYLQLVVAFSGTGGDGVIVSPTGTTAGTTIDMKYLGPS